MAAPLNTCTTIEQRGVVRFFVDKRYSSKGYPQRNAAHVWLTLPVTSSSPHLGAEVLGRADKYRRRTSSRSDYVPTATKRILRRRFPGTCERVGQGFKSVWRLRRKINVLCMSLSPFVSFQSRFVTNLLTFPRIIPAGTKYDNAGRMYLYLKILKIQIIMKKQSRTVSYAACICKHVVMYRRSPTVRLF